MNLKNFRWILSNVFYAGYVSGKLVDGKLIPGKHPALVDLKLFAAANNVLNEAVNVGIRKQPVRDELPLKIFVRSANSNAPFTGYIKKGHWYYKSRGKGDAVNVSARLLNSRFESLLRTFEYRKEIRPKLKRYVIEGLKTRLAEKQEDRTKVKKALTTVRGQLEKIEERYALAEISKEIFDRLSLKYKHEIEKSERILGE